MKLDNKIVTNKQRCLRKPPLRKQGKASHNHQFLHNQQSETKQRPPTGISKSHRLITHPRQRNSQSLKMERARRRTLIFQKLKRKQWRELNQRRWRKSKLTILGRLPWRNLLPKLWLKSYSRDKRWLYNASTWTSTDGTVWADLSTRNHAESPLWQPAGTIYLAIWVKHSWNERRFWRRSKRWAS